MTISFLTVLSLIPFGSHSDHIGIAPAGQRPSISLVVGPVGNETAAAVITYDFSLTPNLLNTGIVAGTPNILVEVGFRKAQGGGAPPTQTVYLDISAPTGLEQTPPNGNTIPISEFSWTVTAPVGSIHDVTLPAGSFSSGTTPFHFGDAGANQVFWMGGELTINYSNNSIYASGSYSGTITYTAYIL
ncbi:MAG: hypothetical protein OEZ68_01615 [Gammaproteobacteria bacterium]|nr:hypothetical protein [Gammaproteobacteria bacterium]MDH5799477.1 hypothetical protein [Gammaproteobacteria bacterium]